MAEEGDENPIPPFFSSLNKPIKDVFTKGYSPGLWSVAWQTSVANGMQFTVNGNQDMGNAKSSASMECRYQYSGLAFTEKWCTDNTIQLEVAGENYDNGRKCSLATKYSPYTGSTSAMLHGSIRRPAIALNCDLDVAYASTLIRTALSTAHYCGLQGGAEIAYDISKGRIAKLGVALGWAKGPFTAFAGVADFSKYEAGFHNKISPVLEAAAMCNWATGSPTAALGAAVKYELDDGATFRAKVDTKGIVGLSLAQKMRPGFILTMSTLINTQHFAQGSHQLGLGIEFES